MSDFQVLQAVRGHLLKQNISLRVHLALPPQAIYPLILVELEEMWSPYPASGNEGRTDIQARIKFKVSVYSQNPGIEEAAILSRDIRKVLEGKTLVFLGEQKEEKTTTLRFLACVTETLGSSGQGNNGKGLRIIHHFYDSIVRG
jgi:hypothetical protein